MSDQSILTEERDGILIITINRPDARNAVNGDVANGMAEALDRLDADDPMEFMDLVQELRATESSAYTESETPIFTCRQLSVERALDALDGEAVRATT